MRLSISSSDFPDTFIQGTLIDLVALDNPATGNSIRTKHRRGNPFHCLSLGIVRRHDRKLVGIASLDSINYISRKCELTGLFDEVKSDDLRFHIEACGHLLRHAFANLNMNKVMCRNLQKEIVHLCQKLWGFHQDGVQREHLNHKGQYRDLYVMSLLRDEFSKIGLS